VFTPVVYSPGKVIREDDNPDQSEAFYSGYTQSKWVAERLVKLARDRGIPVCIYRPGRITGHSRTGVSHADDFLFKMIKGCIQLGSAPDLDTVVDMTPVDFVSRAIVHLSRQQESVGKTFHLVNPNPIHFRKLVHWICAFGFPLRQIPYTDWVAKLTNLGEHLNGNALYPLSPLFMEGIAEMCSHGRLPQFACQHTRHGLAGSSVVCPPVDAELLGTYFSFFIRSGFMDAPPSAGKSQRHLKKRADETAITNHPSISGFGVPEICDNL
jgi:thioester reductase-like protein